MIKWVYTAGFKTGNKISRGYCGFSSICKQAIKITTWLGFKENHEQLFATESMGGKRQHDQVARFLMLYEW